MTSAFLLTKKENGHVQKITKSVASLIPNIRLEAFLTTANGRFVLYSEMKFEYEKDKLLSPFWYEDRWTGLLSLKSALLGLKGNRNSIIPQSSTKVSQSFTKI